MLGLPRFCPRNGEHDSSFELRDVPYVQYFHEGHAAYWHALRDPA